MWVIAAAAVGGLLVLLVRRHDDAQILTDWDKALSPWGQDIYAELEQRVEGELRMVEYAFRRAFNAHMAGSPEEALRLLETGLQVVERTSPDMVELLRKMSIASRMAAALSPLHRLRPRDFNLSRLAGLATAATFIHELLFSTAKRFRLRAYVLEKGFGVATGHLLAHAERIRAQASDADPNWTGIAAARADLCTLSDESLQTFRYLLLSLSATPR